MKMEMNPAGAEQQQQQQNEVGWLLDNGESSTTTTTTSSNSMIEMDELYCLECAEDSCSSMALSYPSFSSSLPQPSLLSNPTIGKRKRQWWRRKDSSTIHPTNNLVDIMSNIRTNIHRTIENDDKMKTPRTTDLLSIVRQYSTIASWICLIDCIVFPVLALALPLLGLFTGDHHHHHHHNNTTTDPNNTITTTTALHDISHFATLVFLLPVGFLTTFMNYITHRKLHVVAIAIIGLILVGISNSYTSTNHWQYMHVVHTGVWHRLWNVIGCLCLVSSNHWSHQIITTMKRNQQRRQRIKIQRQTMTTNNNGTTIPFAGMNDFESSGSIDECCIVHSKISKRFTLWKK